MYLHGWNLLRISNTLHAALFSPCHGQELEESGHDMLCIFPTPRQDNPDLHSHVSGCSICSYQLNTRVVSVLISLILIYSLRCFNNDVLSPVPDSKQTMSSLPSMLFVKCFLLLQCLAAFFTLLNASGERYVVSVLIKLIVPVAN